MAGTRDWVWSEIIFKTFDLQLTIGVRTRQGRGKSLSVTEGTFGLNPRNNVTRISVADFILKCTQLKVR